MSFLKSYENFGRALFWIDDQKEMALQAFSEEYNHRAACGEDACKRSGSTLEPYPFLLDGTWLDASSQQRTVGFDRGFVRVELNQRDGKPVHSWSSSPERPLTSPGAHTVSVALILPSETHGSHGSALDESWHRRMFKLMALSSC